MNFNFIGTYNFMIVKLLYKRKDYCGYRNFIFLIDIAFELNRNMRI